MAHRKLRQMFEEYNLEYFDNLLVNDPIFAHLCRSYHHIELEIRELEELKIDNQILHDLKKERILIKDRAYDMLLEEKNKGK